MNSDVYAVSQYMYMLTNHMYIPTLDADKTEGNPDNGLNKIMRLSILLIRRLDILTSLMEQSSPLFKSYIEVKPPSVRFKIAKNTSYGQSLDCTNGTLLAISDYFGGLHETIFVCLTLYTHGKRTYYFAH